MSSTAPRTLWIDAQGRLLTRDQTLLPFEDVVLELGGEEDCARAIRTMQVRGAPLIGAVAAYGLAFALRADPSDPGLARARADLLATRPTAVNLRWALDRVAARVAALPEAARAQSAWSEAGAICDDDAACNRAIGLHGAALLAPLRRAGAPLQVLTHCNAGALATGGFGTALGVIRAAHLAGLVERVYADETRPWLQGARLTAWELAEDGVPVYLNADVAAAHLMKSGEITWVIVGADRIAANGDVANKIGTYQLAINAMHHGLRFMVVAPSSTIDMSLVHGDDIPIEERDGRELLELGGQRVAAEVPAVNPVFDVTPADLIDVIVTEKGVVERPTEEKMAQLMSRKRLH